MSDIVTEQKNLIEKLVKSNSKFLGNEDLLEDFCSEVYGRSCHVLSGVKEVTAIEGYLRKVVQSSILSVLKDSGRVRRLSKGYTSARKEIPISSLESLTQDNSANKIEENILSDNFSYNLQDSSLSAEEILISKDLLKNVVDIVFKQNVQMPEKQYLDIFRLRYKEQKTQSDIASELGLSQSEVSKRLVEISKFVKSKIDD